MGCASGEGPSSRRVFDDPLAEVPIQGTPGKCSFLRPIWRSVFRVSVSASSLCYGVS